jgi:transcriptional repressor NrdR
MRCPFCQSSESKVVDSRDVEESIRRRRECANPECHGRFTTYERLQPVSLVVVKEDGRRQEFSRAKLLEGIRKACGKRPVEPATQERIAADIEWVLYRREDTDVPARALAELVMERLRDLDSIAYVRFASAYRQFADWEEFQRALDATPRAAIDQPQLPLFAGATLAAPGTPRRRSPGKRRRPRRPVPPTPISATSEERTKDKARPHRVARGVG